MPYNPLGLTFSGQNTAPIILQSEVAECGLACLAMIACYHGYKTDITSLRQKYTNSLKGLNLQQLITFADHMGFAARPVRTELAGTLTLALQCILHWDLTHYVILVTANSKHLIVHDHASGQRSYSHAEFSKHFTGVALELRPAPNFEKKEEVNPVRLRDFWTRIYSLKRNIIHVLFLSAILGDQGSEYINYVQRKRLYIINALRPLRFTSSLSSVNFANNLSYSARVAQRILTPIWTFGLPTKNSMPERLLLHIVIVGCCC